MNRWTTSTITEADLLCGVALKLIQIPSIMQHHGWSSIGGFSHYWHPAKDDASSFWLTDAVATDLLVFLSKDRKVADHLPDPDDAERRLLQLAVGYGVDARTSHSRTFAKTRPR